MRYQIDPENTAPAYLQLYLKLREEISGGTYRKGDRLPAKRAMAEASGLSVVTVEHTYALLEEEGYIEPRQRSGYYVIYGEGTFFTQTQQQERQRDRQEAAEKHRQWKAWLDQTGFPFPAFARTMRRVLSERGEEILISSPSEGSMELRQAIAGYLRKNRNIHVRPEQILIGSGAEYLYSLIAQMLGNRMIYALEDPSYEKIRRVYEAHGITCDMLEMGADGILSSELGGTQARVLHVTPFHSYPSGITATVSKRMEYIRWASERKAYIIEDDFDSEFTLSSKAEETLFSIEPTRTVFYINTFSRTIAPSMRIGYMVIPEQIPEEMKKKIDFYSCTVPVFEQYVLAEFIRCGDFARHINRVRRRLRTLRDAERE